MKTRVDVFLQYYLPHVSGLTNMAATLAEAASDAGFDVHVHCVAKTGSTTHERVNGVIVHAYRRTLSLGRANFSLEFVRAAVALRRVRTGIAHFHLPLPESALFGRLLRHRRASVVTYQCDAPRGSFFERVVARALDSSHRSLIRRADRVLTSSEDYAKHSRLRELFERVGASAIPATSNDRAGGTPRFRIDGARQVGFLGRPTQEKGIDVLMEAIERLPSDVVLTLAGPLDGLSEAHGYDRERLERLISSGRVRSLGFLDDTDLPDFYRSLDVFVLPSINSFEAFGIVQVEAISAGTPVVATALPGVRTIVAATGYGEIADVNDPASLATALSTALSTRYDAERARSVLTEVYLAPVPENAYLEVYRSLEQQIAGSAVSRTRS